ncbi:MAG: mismatch-specific DNA-glycosylase [Gammaproteobacteria bacterium]
METLPDYLKPDLRILSVGLNPSIPSVEAGFYFANPRNRFWKALQQSILVDEVLTPGVVSIEKMFSDHGIGFTDLVKRPTPGMKQLKAVDYRADAPVLFDKIMRYKPVVVWFHGKVTWQKFLRYAMQEKCGEVGGSEWGEQPLKFDGIHFYVTPNPSPANAAFSLDDLVAWYDKLARYLISIHEL